MKTNEDMPGHTVDRLQKLFKDGLSGKKNLGHGADLQSECGRYEIHAS